MPIPLLDRGKSFALGRKRIVLDKLGIELSRSPWVCIKSDAFLLARGLEFLKLS